MSKRLRLLSRTQMAAPVIKLVPPLGLVAAIVMNTKMFLRDEKRETNAFGVLDPEPSKIACFFHQTLTGETVTGNWSSGAEIHQTSSNVALPYL